jgi:hypothetical protein
LGRFTGRHVGELIRMEGNCGRLMRRLIE